jgi:hypothetical protein
MSGWLTNGVPLIGAVTGSERFPLDTQQAAGRAPESAAMSLMRLSAFVSYASNYASTTPVAGTRYFAAVTIGSDQQITGIQALIGAVGGTDKFIYELHDSTGALVATTATAGVTVGTASTWQRIAFTTPYAALAGVYYIAVQLNGTTARLATYNAPSLPIFVGSATGTFGTGASITPPTAYAQATGPVALVY